MRAKLFLNENSNPCLINWGLNYNLMAPRTNPETEPNSITKIGNQILDHHFKSRWFIEVELSSMIIFLKSTSQCSSQDDPKTKMQEERHMLACADGNVQLFLTISIINQWPTLMNHSHNATECLLHVDPFPSTTLHRTTLFLTVDIICAEIYHFLLWPFKWFRAHHPS